MIFTPPTLAVIPPVSISDRRTGPPTQQTNPLGYRLMRYFYNTNSSFQRSRGVNVWRMNDGTYQMSDPVPGVAFTGTIAWPYPDTDKPVNNAISSSWFSGGAAALGANLLSAADSTFNVFSIASTTWVLLNANTGYGIHAFSSLLLRNIGSNPADTTAGTGINVYAATPGQPYSATAQFSTLGLGAPPRSCVVAIAWFTSGGAPLGQVTGPAILDTQFFTTASVFGAVAPATTAFAQVVVSINNVQPTSVTGEQHFVDNVALYASPGVTGGSGPGGSQQLVTPGIAIEYLGGHSYSVSSAEAANLTAVGLGAFVV